MYPAHKVLLRSVQLGHECSLEMEVRIRCGDDDSDDDATTAKLIRSNLETQAETGGEGSSTPISTSSHNSDFPLPPNLDDETDIYIY